jgi:hypothetical protein
VAKEASDITDFLKRHGKLYIMLQEYDSGYVIEIGSRSVLRDRISKLRGGIVKRLKAYKIESDSYVLEELTEKGIDSI